MANEQQARVVRTRLKALLSAESFVSSRGIFNRPSANGLVHVITLQLGQRSLMGSCTVNVGVFIPEVHALFNYPKQGDLWDEGFCEIRQRIGTLMPGEHDRWWPFAKDPDGVAEAITDAVSSYALPFLARFDSRSSIIASWDSLEAATPPRRDLSLALMLAADGRRDEAFAIIERTAQSGGPHLPKLAEKVRAHVESHEAAV